MIKFKNITGDPFLAVGTIQRKFALNGEKSLSGVLYDGDDVLNGIDKGWSLEFDGEPYVVTYFERNDNDNTLSFDAVHKFFWNMSKSVLYSQTSGSHTISWYLDQIFANTGYTYALNFKPKAVSKDNWGMKTKLALFNDIISSISGEFEINGTLISIFEKVGSDLSTIVRYGFNLSDMSIENDAAGFVTYGEGFGAYEDQQNQSGPRLHTTYTSPLASVYGILQAEPVDDQRYTIESNLKDAIKAKIDASFSVSIKLSLYDLTAAGYPYKMAHVGDWLMAIDERLDFKQRIRIISVDDEFDVNGNRISYTVTAGNVGVVQKYQEANASLATQVNNALETANKASDDANIALISANGKNTSYYVDSFDMLPTTANEGDLGWVQAGDGRVLYIYTKKPDGTFYWEKRIDPEMQEQIEAGVDKAVSDAQKYSDKLVADNAEQVNRVLSGVQDKQVELKNEQIEFDKKAQGYANKALEDAKADALKTSQDLVSSIQTEVDNRVKAVSDLDKKAQGYVANAKSDLTASINKEVTDRANAITALDKKATDAINQAKSDAQSAVSALKVGGRNLVVKSGLVSGTITSNSNGAVTTWISHHTMTTDFIAVEPNTDLVAQMWYDKQIDASDNYLRYAFYDKDKVFISRPQIGSSDSTTYNEWDIKTPENAGYIRISFDWIGDGYGHAKLEHGNVATDYTPAPEDIVLDYTTKDNVIKQSLTQYQEANDGRVTKAQSDITQALGESATKVSQTTFNQKTGDLETKYTNVKQTADKATTDIVAIKTKDNAQDTRMANIEADANGLRSTVSSIQTTQGQQSGAISSLQQRADGFDATVTKVNNMAVGGRNLVVTANLVKGWIGNGVVVPPSGTQANTMATDFITVEPNSNLVAQIWYDKAIDVSDNYFRVAFYDADKTYITRTPIYGPSNTYNKWVITTPANTGFIRASFDFLGNGYGHAKIEKGNMATDWSPAPEDLEGATARAQLTADSATTSINNYKKDADGRISKAQADITANANAISQKVSQTTFDTKTGQLQTDLNTTTATANQAKTDIVAIKSKDNAQDARMTTIESDANGTKTTVSHLQTEQSKQSGAISTLEQRANGFDATVTKVNNMSVGGRNLLVMANTSKGWLDMSYNVTAPGDASLASEFIPVTPNADYVAQQWYDTPHTAGAGYLRYAFYDSSKKPISRVPAPANNSTTYSKWNITTPANTAYIRMSFDYIVNGASRAKFEKGNMATDWSPAPEDLEGATARAQLTAEQATTSLNTYKTDNDGRVSRAEANITANANAVSQKVSQSDYNAKTGQIDSQLSSINQRANEITQTVANVQTKVDGMKVGGRNYIKNSDMVVRGGDAYQGDLISTVPTSTFSNQSLVLSVQLDYDNITGLTDNKRLGAEIVFTNNDTGANIRFGAWAYPKVGDSFHGRVYNVIKLPSVGDNANNSFRQGMYVQGITGTNVRLSNPKLEIGTMPTDFSAAPENTESKIATQQITIDGITEAVSKNTSDINSVTTRVTTAEGTITTTRNEVSGLQSKQTQTANQLTTEISDRQTGDSNILIQARDFTTNSISNSENGMRTQLTQTSDSILANIGAVNLFPNSEFEKDYGYRSKNGNTVLSLGSKHDVDGKFNGVVWVKSTASGWQGYWARNIEVQGGQKYSGSVLVHYTNGGVTGGYAALDRWFVDKDGNRINGGIGGSDKGTTGEVTSPYWVKLYFEGVTAPANAVALQVSLLTNDKGAGQLATFTQPMVTATEKLQPYVPNNDITTQLALLKDNWSIGIADNISNITSGIVGNANSMSLISNNVIINSPNTQIKGTAWINRAMIGDGQIGTAQIGDAAITSAKISSLDVNKITGNVSNFIQSNWNGKFASTTIDNSGMSITAGGTVTKFDSTGARYTNNSGINATYSFGKWSDSNGNATSSTGLYLGATGSDNSFINILGTNGSAALVLAGSTMDYGSNLNIMQGTLNSFVNINVRSQLHFKGNRYNSPAYIEINENTRTFNFFTGGGSQGGGNYFWFNQNVLSAGSFSSTSVLSKKNVKSVYDEDALSEIVKTQLVNFAYKNRPDQNHVSPIIDDVNEDKQFYIPKTILGQDGEYVDMYSMISMAWRAIQQLNDKIGDR